MASFSPAQVALTGFGVIRKHPRAVLIWAALMAVFQLGAHYLYLSYLIEIQAHRVSGLTWESRALSTLGPYAPYFEFMLALGLPFLILQGVLCHGMVSAVMNRSVLRPLDSAYGFVRFGADEARQIGLSLLVASAFSGGLILSVKIAAQRGEMGGATGGLAVLLAFAGIAIVLACRLCLAFAQTFDRKTLILFGSWRLTKGLVLPILWTYLLAGGIYLAMHSAGGGVIKGVTMAIGGPDLKPIMTIADARTVTPHFTLAQTIQTLLTAALSAVLSPIVYTVAPAIYQAVSKPEP